MRIAFDQQIFRMQRYGGVSRYFYHLAHEFTLTGDDVRIFDPGTKNAYLGGLPETIRKTSFVESLAARCPRHVRGVVRPILNRLSDRRIRNWKPHLMHATYYQERRSAPEGIPLVITVHDMIHEILPEYFGPTDPTSTDKRTAVSRADHIICISESTRRDLIRIFGVPPQKVTTVHHGFSGMDAAATGLPTTDLTQRPYLLFVGQRAGYKNFQRLLDAFIDSRTLRESFDLIAFGGPPFDAGEIRALAAAGLRKCQVRHETGDDSLLANRYRSASAFVYPSLYEGFGLPPLEAMAQGCPVISSNTSSMPEVIGDAAEYFDPTDAPSISNALLNVLGSSSHSAELVRRGHLRVQQFSWEKCARETRAVYQQVIN